MIELALARSAVDALIADSLTSFARDNPRQGWSTFALYACPWSGWIMSCFDTEANSKAAVARLVDDGLDWYGEDDLGRFNKSCADFAYFEWSGIELPQWQREYEAAEPLRIVDLDGTEHAADSGDEAFNGVVFDFLCNRLRQAEGSIAWAAASDVPARLGVALLDSRYVEFWPVPQTP